MLHRLAGQETEYAIRVRVRAGAKRPTNLTVFRAILAALRERVVVRRARMRPDLESVFVENGGVVSYEAVPTALAWGLAEGGTPECRGPSQLLLYQRAQDRLLELAARDALADLAANHAVEELGLIKNCRDAFGHVYGVQENYDVEAARGPLLLLYRAGLACLLPVSLALAPLVFVVVAVLLVLALVAVPVTFLAAVLLRRHAELTGRWSGDALECDVCSLLTPVLVPLTWLFATPFALLSHACLFRRVRRAMLGFSISRPVLGGAGSVEDDGSFVLCEKAAGIRRVQRWSASFAGRSVIDTANLIDSFAAPSYLRIAPLLACFGRRQRLQLGLSDANRADVAEYLRIGTTCLVIDMAEAGFVDDAPRPVRPVRALRALNADPTLRARVPLRDGSSVTALELQRWYLDRAREFVRRAEIPSLEARDVVRLWAECLDALERDPGTLIGRLDWVTKRWLLERAGADATPAQRKKIDLKYHELGTGYFDRLASEGLAPRMVSDEEIEVAMREAPANTPARIRSRLIKELPAGGRVSVDWCSVRIGGPIRGRVMRLDDYR